MSSIYCHECEHAKLNRKPVFCTKYMADAVVARGRDCRYGVNGSRILPFKRIAAQEDEIERLRAVNKEMLKVLERMLNAHDDYNGRGSSWMAHIYDPIRSVIAKAKETDNAD